MILGELKLLWFFPVLLFNFQALCSSFCLFWEFSCGPTIPAKPFIPLLSTTSKSVYKQTIFFKKILQLIFSLYESHPLQSTWFVILHSTIHLLTSCQILQFLYTVLSHCFWVETLSIQKVCHSPFSTNISSFFFFPFFKLCERSSSTLLKRTPHKL